MWRSRGRARTSDMPGNNRLLCHLSYTGMCGAAWSLGDSNSRHLPCKGSALPTELRPRVDANADTTVHDCFLYLSRSRVLLGSLNSGRKFLLVD